MSAVEIRNYGEIRARLARTWRLLQLQLALGFNPIFKIVSMAVTTALPELVGADCGGQVRHYRKLFNEIR